MPNRPRRSRLWCQLLTALAVCVAAPNPSWSNGTEHIPNGLSDFLGGVLPPPGFYWLNYLVYVQKDTIRDDSGDEPSGVDLDAGVFVEAPRFVWMTPVKILGATYGVQAIIPVYSADVEVDVSGVGKVVDSDSAGLGDITINPLILAWHFSPNFHAAFGLDIVLPTGNYDNDEAASQILSKNHWTFEPLVAVSYWFPGGFDASAKIMYDFHTKNTDPGGGADELKPGQEFHFDWGLSYALGKEDFRLGAAGYYYMQTTEDEIDGEKQDAARLMAAGPAFKWWPGMGRFSVTAKYLKEFAGKNTNEGQSFWLNSVVAF